MLNENPIDPSTLWESRTMLDDSIESGEVASGLRHFGKTLCYWEFDYEEESMRRKIDTDRKIRPIAFCCEQEIQACIRQLDNKEKNSFLLVGPSGCGKTAILQQFFHHIAGRNQSPWLILETSTTQIIQGQSYEGMWERKLHILISLAKRSDNVAVYFTNVQNLIQAGQNRLSTASFAATMAPFLENGELVLIGECTPEIYRDSIEPHPWLKKLFTVFNITSPEETKSQEIIRQIAESQTENMRIDAGLEMTWAEDALEAIPRFGELYFPGIAAPGGASQLIDHLLSLQVNRANTGDSVHSRESKEANAEFEISGKIKLGRKDVVDAVASISGVPSKLLDDSQSLSIKEIRAFFASRILGQPEAVKTVIDRVSLIKAGLNDIKKPLGVMLFVGPTGVGKTEMAKALAEFIFGSAKRMVRYDMSEFKEAYSSVKLIGDPFDGAQKGSLISRIRQQPFSVILFDEIEKAHPSILDLMLQLFDEGRLSDSSGQTADFTQSIIIMTSNLGGLITEGRQLGFGKSEEDPASALQESVSNAIEDHFRPELINRIDNIVNFEPLGHESVLTLAKRELGQVLIRGGITRRHLRIDVEPGVIELLADIGFDLRYGARPLKRAVEHLVLVPIAKKIMQLSAKNRPALLRLIPSGKKISLSVVYDRQARRSASIIQGLKSSRIFGKKKLHSNSLKEEFTNLLQLIERLENKCESLDLKSRKSNLVEQTSQVDFWDNIQAAREALSDIYRIERLLEAIEGIRNRTSDLSQILNEACHNDNEKQFLEIAERLHQIRHHAELVQYSLSLPDKINRCDAFVEISAIDKPTEDLVGKLADMYTNWARKKGFKAKIAHEELITPKTTKNIILLIEGVTIHGLLRDEDGLHEFIYGKTSKSKKRSDYIKVRILPIIDETQENHAKVSTKNNKPKGNGLRCKKYRSGAEATHKIKQKSISIRNNLIARDTEEIARELLLAECSRMDNRPDGSSNSICAVRKYTLRPNPSAIDCRTGVTTSHLEDLWGGGLDPFLTVLIEERKKT